MMDLAMPSANSWFGIRLLPDVLQPTPRNDLPGLGAGSGECGDVEKMQWIAGSGGTSRVRRDAASLGNRRPERPSSAVIVSDLAQ